MKQSTTPLSHASLAIYHVIYNALASVEEQRSLLAQDLKHIKIFLIYYFTFLVKQFYDVSHFSFA